MTDPSPDEFVVLRTFGQGEPVPLLVSLPPDFAEEAADVAQEAAYLLFHTANVIGLVGELVRSGQLGASDHRLGSLAEVCERAFRNMAETEGEVLDKLGAKVRRAVAARREDQRAADLHRQREEANHAAHD